MIYRPNDIKSQHNLELGRIVSERSLFQLVFDSLPLQVVVKSMRQETTGQFLLLNRVAEEWIGFQASQVIGRTDYDLFPREQADFFREMDLKVMQSGESLQIPEETLLSHTRGLRHLSTIKTPIFDTEGRPLALLVVSEDITERKLFEEKLLESKLVAENANHAKGDFLAMMSHEIRTPLNGVLGFAELLASTQLDKQQVEYVQTIRESGSNLLSVLNDVLDYSKIESGKLTIDSRPTNLRDLVLQCIETFRAQAHEKSIELVGEFTSDAPSNVLVDGMRLRQVLVNLISNAVKFTHAGRVTVRFEDLPHNPGDDGLGVRLTVSDTGIGISPEALTRLFEPFEQLDSSMARRYGGTGLGLAIVHRLVGLLGGRVHVESQPDIGTEFRFELTLVPCKPGEDPPSPMDSSPAPVGVERPLSILLVKLMLKRLGYSADEAVDGAQAVDRAKQRCYDVILMDIQMPGMDGYHATRVIREFSPDTQILALTAHALTTDQARSEESGMKAHLSKPIRVDELREALMACSKRLKSKEASLHVAS